MKSKLIKSLVICFDNPLQSYEIPAFRGAVISLVGEGGLLYHNHDGNSLRYKYPLIQYKRIHGKAALVCIGEGVEKIGSFFAAGSFDVRIGQRQVTLVVEDVQVHQTLVTRWDNIMFDYHLHSWLPLNQENYAKYMSLESLAEKCAMLEHILIGNILSYTKGMDVWLEHKAECIITALGEPYPIVYKGVRMMAFDADFKCNVSLPEQIGLGKSVSVGMGTVVRKFDVPYPKKVFLLGGHDLEMETIRQFVDQSPDCLALDLNLTWYHALLSRYSGIFDLYPHSEFYAVELQEDMEVPVQVRSRFHIIDHHNEYAGRPSSLEQVAEILGVELDRWHRLVAANDSGYVPAMKAMMATDDEIQEVRFRDRAAQGVTEEDEREAEESIEHNLQKIGDLMVVKSSTHRFSPICDRLYPYKSLLVHTDKEFCFYGEGKSELVEQFADKINRKRMYHGGGENGYIGCGRCAFKPEIIEKIVEQIKQKYDA